MRTVFALRIAHSRSAWAPTMLMEVGLADGPCALTSCLDAPSHSKTVPCGCVSGGGACRHAVLQAIAATGVRLRFASSKTGS